MGTTLQAVSRQGIRVNRSITCMRCHSFIRDICTTDERVCGFDDAQIDRITQHLAEAVASAIEDEKQQPNRCMGCPDLQFCATINNISEACGITDEEFTAALDASKEPAQPASTFVSIVYYQPDVEHVAIDATPAGREPDLEESIAAFDKQLAYQAECSSGKNVRIGHMPEADGIHIHAAGDTKDEFAVYNAFLDLKGNPDWWLVTTPQLGIY